MNFSCAVFLFSVGLIGLSACSASSAADDATDGQSKTSSGSDDVGPLSCSLSSDDGSGIVPVSVACAVTIGNIGNLAPSTVQKAVRMILQGKTLVTVCPRFTQQQVLAAPIGFSDAVGAELSAELGTSGTGWSVQSLSCVVKDT